MAEDWDAIALEVAAELADIGRQAFIRRTIVTDAPNPSIPGSGSESTEDYYCSLVEDEYSIRQRESSMVQEGDKKLLVSAPIALPALTDSEANSIPGTAGIPTSSDKVILDGIAYAIVSCTPNQPGGTPVVFEIQARK